MNAKDFKDLLISLWACDEAVKWAEGKSWQEVYATCHKGDWLCWLFKRTNPDDLQLLTLVKGHQANTVRHLIKDERSIKAIDVAIAFGEGRATREELKDATGAAYDADTNISHHATYAAIYAAHTNYAGYAAIHAASAAYDAAFAANLPADSAESGNLQLTADIVRKYLPIEIWNI